MSWAILGLVAGFIFVLAVLSLMLFKSGFSLPVKLLLVGLVTGFYWVQYISLQQYAGWPVSDRLPDEFVLIATDIIEPSKQTGDAGVMYWWIRESGEIRQPPRVYRLPYEAKVHEQSAEVLKQQKQGSQFIGRQAGNPFGSTNLGISFEKISKAERHKKEKLPIPPKSAKPAQ